MGKISELLNRLEETNSIKKQFLILLFWSRIYEIVRRSIVNEYLRLSGEKSYRLLSPYETILLSSKEKQQRREKLNELLFTNSVLCSPIKGKQFTDLHNNVNKRQQKNGIQSVYDLSVNVLGVPKMWPALKYYEIISTVYISYLFSKYLLPIEWLISYAFGDLKMPVSCYLPGRLLVYQPIANSVSLGLCFFHLSWRFKQKFHFSGSYKINVLNFLIQRDCEISRLFSQFGNEFYQIGKIEKIVKENNQQQQQQQQFNSIYAQYVLSTMYYPIRLGKKTMYRLRFNRSGAARLALKKHVKMVFLATIVVSFLACASVGPIVFFEGLTDSHYHKSYPNCSKSLLNYSEYTRYTLSFNEIIAFKSHRLIALIFDYLHTFVVLIDLLGTIYVCAFIEIIVHDLMKYWTQIDFKLKCLKLKLRRKKYIKTKLRPKSAISTINNSRSSFSLSNRLIMPSLIKGNSSGETLLTKEEEDMDFQSHEVQSVLEDFFVQLKLCDALVSEVLTMAVFSWMVSCIGISYYNSKGLLSGTNTLFRFLVVIFFLFCNALNVLLINMHNYARGSYKTICSIMAYEKDEHKIQLVKLISHYYQDNRFSFTIGGQLPFNATTYSVILSYTVSIAFIFYTFLH